VRLALLTSSLATHKALHSLPKLSFRLQRLQAGKERRKSVQVCRYTDAEFGKVLACHGEKRIKVDLLLRKQGHEVCKTLLLQRRW
jgi:hypothetical protein